MSKVRKADLQPRATGHSGEYISTHAEATRGMAGRVARWMGDVISRKLFKVAPAPVEQPLTQAERDKIVGAEMAQLMRETLNRARPRDRYPEPEQRKVDFLLPDGARVLLQDSPASAEAGDRFWAANRREPRVTVAQRTPSGVLLQDYVPMVGGAVKVAYEAREIAAGSTDRMLVLGDVIGTTASVTAEAAHLEGLRLILAYAPTAPADA